MKLRYALPALLLLASSAAMAQLPTRAAWPLLEITSPASIAAVLANSNPGAVPTPPYPTPILNGDQHFIGTSWFWYADAAGDSVSMGTYHTTAGVTGQIELALRADGTPAFGCDGSEQLTNDIDNAADLAGKIVLIQRGPVGTGLTACGFFLKAQRLQAAGAIGVIIYNNIGRNPDTSTNMSGSAVGDTPVGIPTMLLPWHMTEPIFNEIAGGTPVAANMRCDFDLEGSCFAGGGVAGEGAPSAAGAGFFLTGANPVSSTARFEIRTPAAEHVAVVAYNMLGQRVATLFEGAVLDRQAVSMNTANLPAGSYFVRAVGETFNMTQQITVVR